MQCRDTIYEEIMEKGYNEEKKVPSLLPYISISSVMEWFRLWDVRQLLSC